MYVHKQGELEEKNFCLCHVELTPSQENKIIEEKKRKRIEPADVLPWRSNSTPS